MTGWLLGVRRLAAAVRAGEERRSDLVLFIPGSALDAASTRTATSRLEVADAQWLSGADLVILKGTYDGSVRRTLEIHDVPLSAVRVER